MTGTVVGIAWYYRGDYPRILRIMTDADDLPATYDAWIRSAEQVERQLKRNGLAVMHVIIEPDAFLDWCRSRGIAPNAQARSTYSSEETKRLHQTSRP
jgi:hypothetical protein